MLLVNYTPRQVYPIIRKQCVNSTAAWPGPQSNGTVLFNKQAKRLLGNGDLTDR